MDIVNDIIMVYGHHRNSTDAPIVYLKSIKSYQLIEIPPYLLREAGLGHPGIHPQIFPRGNLPHPKFQYMKVGTIFLFNLVFPPF
jgi:hypothetical protein